MFKFKILNFNIVIVFKENVYIKTNIKRYLKLNKTIDL